MYQHTDNGPRYTDDLRILLDDFGQQIRDNPSQGLDVSLAQAATVVKDNRLKAACLDIVAAWRDGSDQFSRLILAHHRDVFPLPVIASLARLEFAGRMDEISGKLEPMTAEEVRQELLAMQEGFAYEELGPEWGKIKI